MGAARGLGFPAAAEYALPGDEPRGLVEGGRYPLAYLRLEAIRGTADSHPVSVVGASAETAAVYDPPHRERRLPRQSFTAWASRRHLVPLVGR